MVLDVADLETVTCTGETAKGEVTGPKTVGSVDLTFTGCTEVAGNPRQSASQPPERIVTNSLQGELGIIKEFPAEIESVWFCSSKRWNSNVSVFPLP